jgi:phosphatidate cytidylyltransferase
MFAYGPKWFLILLFLACVGVTAYEASALVIPALVRMSKLHVVGDENTNPGQNSWHTWYGAIAISGSVLAFLASSSGASDSARGMLIVVLLAIMMIGAFSSRVIEHSLIHASGLMFVVCYSALPWLSIWDLYLMGDGSRFVLYLIALVWAGDSGAYFAGRFWGKHKMSPTISPKKTWEGAVGGLVSSVAGGAAVHLFFLPTGGIAPWRLVIISSIAGGIVGQLGDLIESILKRSAQVKDSGQIFPGHGGFLDRVDSLLFAAPVVWFILYAFGSSI